MRCCRLVYRSLAKPEILQHDTLEALITECVMHNERQGIKGLLVQSGNQFLQVLEGPPRFVNQLFGRIITDSRHQDVELISYEGTAKPHFYDWSMQLVDLNRLSPPMRELFMRKYAHHGNEIELNDDPVTVYSLLLDAKAAGHRASTGTSASTDRPVLQNNAQ